MDYRVEVSDEANHNADEAYLYLARDSPSRAERWYSGLLSAIASLATHPRRCEVAVESAWIGREIRQLLYGRRRGVYRILFEICGDEVRVLHIRHSARDYLRPPEE
jgi:plasmid stabilization system protein ParE